MRVKHPKSGSQTRVLRMSAVYGAVSGVKYDYTLEYNGKFIAYELLEFNPNGVSSLFYERKHNDTTNLPEITFGKNVALDSKTATLAP